jgi:FkbM family methyltransferase
MRQLYVTVKDRVKASPAFYRAARLALRAVPDVPVTMNVPELGRLRFGLRRHRWLLGANCLGGHATTLATFHRLVRPGDTFYDVGANIGYYARFVLRHLPVGRLVAFEPMSANVRLLQANVELGGYGGGDRVTVLPFALGDRAGREDLQVDDMSDGSAVLTSISGGRASEGRRHLGLAPKTEQIEVLRMDDVIARESLPPPNVIKIDTEGAEASVLRGATETLRRHRPRLAVSLHGAERGAEALAALADAGYACYGFMRDGSGGRVYRRIDVGEADDVADNNIVCSTDEADVREPTRPLDLTPIRSGGRLSGAVGG